MRNEFARLNFVRLNENNASEIDEKNRTDLFIFTGRNQICL